MSDAYFAIDGIESLSAYLKERGIALWDFRRLDSTSSEARRRAGHVSTPACFLADEQTGGRGRMGRSFFSPAKTGLYLSVLLARHAPTSDMGLTAAAAVAARRAIRAVTGIEVGIKWVNDLYLGERKIAGILCESFAVEGQRFAVVGIGINLYTEDFPEELQNKAGSLRPRQGLRHALAAALVTELCSLVEQLPRRDFMSEYREAAIATGRRVRFIENGIEHRGIAMTVEEDGALPVRLTDGRLHRLYGGEISLLVEKENETNEKGKETDHDS